MSIAVKYIGRQVETVGESDRQEEGILPFFSVDQVKTLRYIFGFLNDKDRDILYLIFVSRKKQKDVQRIMNRSQPSLCYDIKRIRHRLRYIFYIHSVFDLFSDFVRKSGDYFLPHEIEILTLMLYTSSFTMTAKMMGASQVRIRYAFNKCIDRMEELEIWDIYEIFSTVRNNLNSLKRVYGGSGIASGSFNF